MEWQFKVGLGVAVIFGLLPYAVKDMPHWVTWSGIAAGLTLVAWGLLPSHERLPVGPVALFVVGVATTVAAAGWYWDISQSGDAGTQAVARLSELGWTVKPGPDGIQFEIVSKPLPPMKESAAYFEQLGRPFNLHFQQVPGIQGLHYLANIAGCTKIEINAGEFTDISELRGFTHLTNLGISQLPLNGIETVDLSPLSSLTSLQQLNLGMVRTRSIAALAPLKRLKILNLGQTLIADISALSGIDSLESVEIRGTRVVDLRPLTQDKNLKDLTVGGAQLPGLVDLAHLPNLKKLTIIEQQNLDLSSVGSLTNLESLWIWSGYAPIDASPLHNLTKLRALTITGVGFGGLTAVPNIQVLGGLKELRSLTLGQLQITDLNFLASLTNLNEINLSQLPISSIEPLRGLNALNKVALVDMPIVDISPLLALPALSNLTVGRTPARSDVLSELGRRGVKITSW
jgi:hypothetical protein